MKKIYSIIIIGLLMSNGLLAQTVETILTPSKDNSIYQEGELSNGAGERIFAGVTREENKRRALIKFDLSEAVPEGATVDSAQLILRPSLVKTDGTTVTLHMLTSDWGEGTSDAEGPEGKGAPATDGDATWTMSSVGGDPWVKPGGDYEFETLGTAIVSTGTDAMFGSPLLADVVNDWINDPSSNYGVIVIGDETKNPTAIRFNSREFSDSETWPRLKLYYQGATSANPKEFNAHNMLVYPDQSSSALMIRNNFGAVSGTIELYSISGSLLFSDQRYLSEGENRINTGLEASGIYLYRIVSEAGVVSGKFMHRVR